MPQILSILQSGKFVISFLRHLHKHENANFLFYTFAMPTTSGCTMYSDVEVDWNRVSYMNLRVDLVNTFPPLAIELPNDLSCSITEPSLLKLQNNFVVCCCCSYYLFIYTFGGGVEIVRWAQLTRGDSFTIPYSYRIQQWKSKTFSKRVENGSKWWELR